MRIARGWPVLFLIGCAAEERAAIDEPCDGVEVGCVAGAYCGAEAPALRCEPEARCVAVATACAGEQRPACGCDGVVYASACAAAMAGVGVTEASQCEAPAGSFGCRGTYCRIDSQYCEWIFGGGKDAWSCRELGCEGDAQGCACLPDESPCSVADLYVQQVCSPGADGGARLTCLRP